jgi:endonuclease YncB( thermonuclease family)
MGLLIAEGRIAVEQLWPSGWSDADTVRVQVGRFLFTRGRDPRLARETRVFANARVVGRRTRSVIDTHGRISVRLQGVDAPELHCPARLDLAARHPRSADREAALHAIDRVLYRQHLGETAAFRLGEHLRALANGARDMRCRILTRVDAPDEVCDTYARVVGNVVLAGGHDLGVWLVEQGWAFPSFYASMEAAEIRLLLAAARKARAAKRGVWRHVSGDTRLFDWKLVFRGGARVARFDPLEDQGAVLLPKVFRRVVSYRVSRRVGLAAGSLGAYLRRHRDRWWTTREFLRRGRAAEVRYLEDMFDGSRFTGTAAEMVFEEAESRLVDARGRRIVAWRCRS